MTTVQWLFITALAFTTGLLAGGWRFRNWRTWPQRIIHGKTWRRFPPELENKGELR